MIWVQIQYREDVDPGIDLPWTSVPDFAVTDTPPRFLVGHIGETFQVRLRYFDDTRVRWSEWRYLDPVTIGYTNPPPAAIQNARIVCGENLVWDPPEGDQPGAPHYDVRTAPGFWRHFEDMVPVSGDWLPGSPMTLCGVPKGIRSFAITPIDDEGQRGDVAYLVADRGPYDDVEPVLGRTTSAAPGWTNGTITNGTVVGGLLKATGYSPQPAWTDDAAPAWQDDDTGAAWPSMFQQMYYTVSYDPGTLNGSYIPNADGGALTLSPTVLAGENWRCEWRPHDASAWTDNDTDPYWTHDSSLAWHGVDNSSPVWGNNADPFWGPDDFAQAWNQYPWRPWPGRLGSFPLQRMDFRVVTRAGPVRGILGDFVIHESVPVGVIPGEDPGPKTMDLFGDAQAVSPGPTRVTFSTPFLQPPNLAYSINTGSGVLRSVSITEKTPRWFEFRLYDQDGTEKFDAILSWRAIGGV